MNKITTEGYMRLRDWPALLSLMGATMILERIGRAFPERQPERSTSVPETTQVTPGHSTAGDGDHLDGTVLHKLWGIARDNPGYDKADWLTLQREFRRESKR